MSLINKLSMAFVLIFLLTSCSQKLTYFSQKMVNDFDWTENDLQKIQFYLSDDIELTRALGTEDSRITKGKIRVENGREVEVVRFKKGTPGLAVFSPKNNRMAVSFESEDDKFLMFGPNKKTKGRYVLLAKNWEKNYGEVTYDGKIYRTSSSSAYSALMVDIDKAKKVRYKSSTAEGRKI